MIASMTGFARRELAGSFGTLVCEIRSVNHRFLDASLRLPDSCRPLEPELRQAIAQTLKRGKVDCTLNLRATEFSATSLEIDETALAQLLTRLRALSAALPSEARVDLVELLRFPGIVRQEGLDPELLFPPVRAVFSDTLQELARTRAREGARLAGVIEQRVAQLQLMVDAIRARLPEVRVRLRQRFDERLAELGAALDRDRLEQEVLLLLQRVDCDEELDRLGGHIVETLRALQSEEPAGRRLDFLMQELNREANTLSSKSPDLETTRTVVEMKVLIEQMREQVQNVE
jgi:uncharacterized protein (TIGR00255 family)